MKLNVTTTVPEVLEVPEANVTTTVPEVPEANVTTTVPLENNTGLVNLELSVKQDPISSGEEQTVTLIASDPITGSPLDRIFCTSNNKGSCRKYSKKLY